MRTDVVIAGALAAAAHGMTPQIRSTHQSKVPEIRYAARMHDIQNVYSRGMYPTCNSCKALQYTGDTNTVAATQMDKRQ